MEDKTNLVKEIKIIIIKEETRTKDNNKEDDYSILDYSTSFSFITRTRFYFLVTYSNQSIFTSHLVRDLYKYFVYIYLL